MTDSKLDDKLIYFLENDPEIKRLRNKIEECIEECFDNNNEEYCDNNKETLKKIILEIFFESGIRIQEEAVKLAAIFYSNPTYVQLLPH
jgi:hypothetical protein